MMSRNWRTREIDMPARCCRVGLTLNGLPAVRRCRPASRSVSSRWRARSIPTTCRRPPMPGAAPTFPCMRWRCTRIRGRESRRSRTESAGRSGLSRICARAGTRLPMWATWSGPAPAASQRPIPSCGLPARTFPLFQTSALVASALAARLRLSFTTRWRTRGRCRLNLM